MRRLRTLFAILIALSLALTPLLSLTGVTMAAPESVASNSDCDTGDCSCPMSKNDCQSAFACAIKCFKVTGIAFAALAATLPLTSAEAPPPRGLHAALAVSPPIRPPLI